MSETTAPVPVEQPPHTILSAASSLGGAVVRSVPPSFLGLALINALFLGTVLLFLDHVINVEGRAAEQRMDIFEKVIDTCMSQVGSSQDALVKAQQVLFEQHRASMLERQRDRQDAR